QAVFHGLLVRGEAAGELRVLPGGGVEARAGRVELLAVGGGGRLGGIGLREGRSGDAGCQGEREEGEAGGLAGRHAGVSWGMRFNRRWRARRRPGPARQAGAGYW